MNPSSSNGFLLFLVLLFAASEAGFLLHKADILVYNDFTTDLTIHCKSKNDDLGVHVLPYRNYFEFKFRPHFWGVTLFYCRMEWDGTTHWFDIYVQNRDSRLCNRCLWNGFCSFQPPESGSILHFAGTCFEVHKLEIESEETSEQVPAK
ncbi:S-protein homolog 20-like [Hibiscus syriacus]|uniref:S-protein homolog 20-like n=1 Tax=Hibiscus syriacus TaxID=106335 RepID=UPI001922AE2E|nr:S-protein homolog 20-like [Hibiscus syriacus]